MMFERYIGIDYSGAETPVSGLSALRVYEADAESLPREVAPQSSRPSRRKHWTRRGVAEWLREQLTGPERIVVGLDHAFSFPLRYFETHGLAKDWPTFLDDFHGHWPTDGEQTSVDSIRKGMLGKGAARSGDARWLRVTERWTSSAKSVFHFDVQGAVAKSTHAGLPWLRYLRNHCGERVHFWPFDGWEISPRRSVVAEVYPALWMRRFPSEGRIADQQAAYSVAAWLRRTDARGEMGWYFGPRLDDGEMEAGRVEGWIFGVV